MEENRPDQEIQEQNIQQQEIQPPVYQPRPAWQVWAARIGVGIVLMGFILYCLHIAGFGI